MNVTHPDYQLTTNIWLTSVMVMPTAQTPRDRTTAVVRKVIREMEINVMVNYYHAVWLQINAKLERNLKFVIPRINLDKINVFWRD